MPSTPEVTVVTPTYDRRDRLIRLLDALRRQTLEPSRFEVVVVNDASPDDTRAVLDAAAARGDLNLRPIHRDENGGRAQAREDGWRAGRAPLVAFTDDDCEPVPDWLEAGLAAHAREPEAIVQGRTEPNPEDLAALPPSARPFSRTIRVSAHDPGYPTCNIFFPRELLERIDGFDTDLFGRVHGGEDADLAWRAIKAGAPVVFEADALVHHAVANLGPIGKLKVAANWELAAVARHPELRAALFFRGPFWKQSHYLLARALAALLVPKRFALVRVWLAAPYLIQLAQRARAEGGSPLIAPWYFAHDLAEMYAVARGAVRNRHLLRG